MQRKFPRLFEPMRIGKVRVKNRIAMAPMGFPALSDFAGLPTQRYVDYFTERARGGVGLLLTGMLKVEDNIEHSMRRRGPIREEFVRPFADLSEAAHALGAKIFGQLSAGFGHQARPGSVRGGPVSASAIPNFGDTSITCRALTTTEVEQLVKAFGNAAEIFARAGVDGVELHGHGGFLLDQFTTSVWNRRDDKYGGDLAARMTFPIEILKEIRQRLGADFPVTYRYGLKHYMKTFTDAALPGEPFLEVGRDVDEGLEMARRLEDAGFDALAVDAGTLAGHYWSHPPMYQKHGCLLDMAALVKEVVDIPVLAVGRLDIPEMAEQALVDGKADMISLARGLLADPYWPNKVLQGQVEDIRPCIGCHQACTEAYNGREINSCTVNPAAGREAAYALRPALNARTVLVVGGGIAGMEAARVSATRGHAVTLFEKSGALGGHLLEAGVPDDKKDVERLNQWYVRQLDKLGVNVRLHTKVTSALIEHEQPEVVVVASGSQDVVPRLPGVHKPHVITTTEALLEKKPTGTRVVVVGAGENGCEAALWLAKKGREVTLLEMQSRPMSTPVARSNKNMLLDSLAFHRIPIRTHTTLVEVLDGAVVVREKNDTLTEIPCDTVVLAVGLRADDQLHQQLTHSLATPLYAIGDCQEPRNIMRAIWEGFEVGRTV